MALLMALACWSLFQTLPVLAGNDDQCGSMCNRDNKKSLEIGDPIMAASGALRFALPLLNLGGPMNVHFTVMYGSDYVNWPKNDLGFGNAGNGRFWWSPGCAAYLDPGLYQFWLDDFRQVAFDPATKEIMEFIEPQSVRYQLEYSDTYVYLMDPIRELVYIFSKDTALIKAVLDRDGNQLTYAYDGDNRLETMGDGLGRALNFTYTDIGGTFVITQVADHQGRSVNLDYDAQGADNNKRGTLRSISDPLNQTTTFSYTPTNFITSVQHPEGNVPYTQEWAEKAIYNDSFATRVVKQTTAYNHVTELDYDNTTDQVIEAMPDGNQTIYEHFGHHAPPKGLTDAASKSMEFTRNDRNQITGLTDRTGGQTLVAYHDQTGKIASVTNAKDEVLTYTYTAQNQTFADPDAPANTVDFTFYNLTKIDYPDETSETFTYDANGNLNAITDPDTQQTLFSHDVMDRVKETTNARTKKTQYAYDNMNRLQSVTDPNNNTIQYGYNSRDWLDKVTDAAGHEWTTGFDNEGLPTSTTTPMGRTTTITRDALGYISNIKNPLNQETVFTRDEMSRVTKITDALTRETSFSYDNAGRLTGVTLPVVGAATYRRNGLGLVDRITDLKGSVWDFTYTDMGRLSTQKDPQNNQRQYSYDTQGRLNQITYPGGSTQTRTYDDAGNLLRSLHSAGPDLNYTYNNQNRLLTAENIAFTYNETNQVRATTNPGTTFGATYDDGGRVKTVTYASDLFTVTYTYDNRDLVTKVADSLTNTVIDFSYDKDGRLTGMTRSNSANTTFAWDATSHLTRLQHGALANLQYTYNAAGEVTKLDYDLPLDPAEHLTSGMDSFAYDEASQIATAGYAYDNQGRQTASPGQTFIWDGASRLTATTDAALTYNGLNDLLTRQTGGSTTHYYYNYALDLHPIVAEYNETTSSWKRFYVLTPGGKLLYLIDAANGNAVAFYHYDHIGNTLFLTNAAGAMTDTYAYTPYGKLLAHEGYSDQPFTFVGAWQVRQERSNGLYQMRARYYHANVGKFMSREPLWPLPDSPKALNPYQYALNNPLRFMDITGRFAITSDENEDMVPQFALNVILHMDHDLKGFEEDLLEFWDRLSFEERLRALEMIQKGLVEADAIEGFKWNDRERAVKFLNQIHKKQLELRKAGKRPDILKAGWNARAEEAKGGKKGGKAVEKDPDANHKNEFFSNPETEAVKPVSFSSVAAVNPQDRAVAAALEHISRGEKQDIWCIFWNEANNWLADQK
ncbi:MAG: RHS repeat-associated core domain-containing protein [Candidatus Desulfacyla sp.]